MLFRSNTWAQFGNRGWSWEDVLPVFERMEHFEGAPGPTRATGGPLRVSVQPDQNPFYDAMFEGAKSAGFKVNPDYNGPDQEGVVKTQTTISSGRRMSTAEARVTDARGKLVAHGSGTFMITD